MNQNKLEQILADKLVHHVMEADECSKSEAISSMKKAMKENPKMFIGIFEAMEEYAQQALESYKDGCVSISQDELMIELADKRLCRFSNLDPTIYSLSLKHTAEHLLDKYSITRLPTPPQTKTI